MTNTAKFRPALTPEQVRHILELTQSAPHSPINIQVKRIFSTLHAKISAGVASPAYVKSGARTLEFTLGLGSEPESTPTPTPEEAQKTKDYLEGKLSPEESLEHEMKLLGVTPTPPL